MSLVRAPLLLLALLPVTALAADPTPEGVWSGKGQLGYVGTQGNTDSTAVNAAIDMALVDAPWKHALHFGGLYGKNTGVTSSERWDAGWQSNYDVNKSAFVFGALRYAHDMFSGFQYQRSVTLGVGDKIFDTDATKLSVQIGAGYRQSRPELLDKVTRAPQILRTLLPSQNDAILTAGLDFTQVLTTTTTLTDKLLVESGSSNTLVTNALALTVKMSDKMALSLGYALQDNSKPPAGLKSLDSVETVNLVYSF